MANAFSSYLPYFPVTALAGLVRPLGGAQPAPGGETPAEAEARGRREALAEAQAAFDQTRKDDLADHDLRLIEKERQFAQSVADLLAERLIVGLSEIETAMSARVAHILMRFLDGAVRARALAELSEVVGALLTSSGSARVKVTGPEALVNRLRERLAPHTATIDYTIASEPDLTVTIDDTIMETRIAEWMERIVAAVPGEPHG